LNSRNIRARLLLALLVALAPLAAAAQEAAGPSSGSQPAVAYASVNELNSILSGLQQTAANAQADLGNTRVEKWKTDGATRRQAIGNVEAIQRNLRSALPEIIAQLNNAPEDLGVSFKLYRNLDLLCDVFASVAESAGAFGSKDEFQSLSNDMNGLEAARRAFGERMQKLAVSKEQELSRLREQVKTLTAAPPPPPKKIVVDDTEPPKKPVRKKPAPAKPPAANPTTTTTPPPPSAAPVK
jgi:hypothetical protein